MTSPAAHTRGHRDSNRSGSHGMGKTRRGRTPPLLSGGELEWEALREGRKEMTEAGGAPLQDLGMFCVELKRGGFLL
jgi:hypothetical protein